MAFVLTDAKGNRVIYGGTPLLLEKGALLDDPDWSKVFAPYMSVWCDAPVDGVERDIPVGQRLDYMDTPIHLETR